jgi:hypothetical protein
MRQVSEPYWFGIRKVVPNDVIVGDSFAEIVGHILQVARFGRHKAETC